MLETFLAMGAAVPETSLAWEVGGGVLGWLAGGLLCAGVVTATWLARHRRLERRARVERRTLGAGSRRLPRAA